MKCDICGKIPTSGSTISHSKRHAKRRWQPNVHPVTMEVDGEKKKLSICSRCLRSQNKISKKAPAQP